MADMERSFRKEMASLAGIFAFLDACYAACAGNGPGTAAVTLAVEELFTNMVRHSSGSRSDITIAVTCRENGIRVAITENDVEPFDITRPPDVDTSLSLDRRPVGGLGIYLVHQLVENLTYDYADRRSTITFSKTLEMRHAHGNR